MIKMPASGVLRTRTRATTGVRMVHSRPIAQCPEVKTQFLLKEAVPDIRSIEQTVEHC